ncbi:M48 family metalloprotease, partial [Singulisphaera rosea]
GGSGARLRGVSSSINAWLARVVYERDEWDESLRVRAAAANGGELFAVCARFAIWLNRRVLWVLLHVGYLVEMAFMRQREYDADRYEARMIGAKTFAKALWRLRELGLSSEYAMVDLRSSWKQGRLPDNYPKLILANVPQIPKEVLAKFREASGQAKTSLFSTHPSDRDRIDRAKLEAPGEGIFNLDGPASDLFAHFDSLCRLLTFEYYKALLGRDISKSQLYPVVELVESQAVEQEGYVTADRFFLEALPVTQSFSLPSEYPKVPAQAKAAKQELDKARKEQRAARAACLAALKRSG